MKVNAYSKVNLSLDITGKRPDGYHTLCSVMQSVSLCDTITLSLKTADKSEIRLLCSDDSICEEDNLAFKAAQRYLQVSGINAIVDIYIEKNIPLAGGLGGGSADAAAVLGTLNLICGNKLNQQQINDLALSLGADVPFCFNGGTVLAEGIGEKMTKLDALPDCLMLIAKKGFKGSTGEMYKKLDSAQNTKKSDVSAILQGLSQNDIKKAALGFYNCFETVCPKDSLEIKEVLLRNGAIFAGLSGAGPSVVGIFDSEEKRSLAYDVLKSAGAEVFLCEPKKVGFEIVK